MRIRLGPGNPSRGFSFGPVTKNNDGYMVQALRNRSGPISPCSNSLRKIPSGRRANSRANFLLRIESGTSLRSLPSIASISKAQSCTSSLCLPECSALKRAQSPPMGNFLSFQGLFGASPLLAFFSFALPMPGLPSSQRWRCFSKSLRSDFFFSA
jgi:hypothetical protein